MRTPHIITIIIEKTDVILANELLEINGFGPNNFSIDCDNKFVFVAPLQQWEYDRIISAFDESSITYKLSEYPNDGNVKEKIMDTLTKEGLSIKVIE